ncbi:MAG TPA: DNA repair protein RecN, partial [Candidatus Obscuribacterales bacterium]
MPSIRLARFDDWAMILPAGTTARITRSDRLYIRCMLQSLEIRDFALIEHVEINWTDGLNVLTGETGAGKSIVMDALNAVLGGKAGAGSIRNGCERARIEATFVTTSEVIAWLKQNELMDEESNVLTVAREINRQGSKIRVNGTLISHNMAQELGSLLLTVHAQHEARTLMSPQLQLDLLDGLGNTNHKKLVEKTKALYLRRRELMSELNDLKMSDEERVRKLDFARFQLNELEEADLCHPDEDAQLGGQLQRLKNAAQLEEAVRFARTILAGGSGGDGDMSARDAIQKSLTNLERAERFDSELTKVGELLRTSLIGLEDAVSELRRYAEKLDVDPESLSILENRHALLTILKKKYGPTLQQVIDRKTALRHEIEVLEHADQKVSRLHAEADSLSAELASISEELSGKRRKLALELARSVEKELAELGMERCKFEINFRKLDEPCVQGVDRLEYLIAPNPGQPPMPLAKIASGGELSRIMLAIKTIFASADRVPTVIFDEIDTGMSGKVLQAMRDKLAKLSRSHQILCITHQPIIASIADNHLEVKKTQ